MTAMRPVTAISLGAGSAACLLVAVMGVLAPSFAQQPAAAVKAVPQVSAGSSSWKDLTVQQREALKPLDSSWSGIGEAQKRKWLAFTENFSKLSPAEQTRVHSRMTDWVALSPTQRQEARFNFAETKQLAPDEKKAKWQAYQALSPAEKQKFVDKPGPRPTGAATSVKPVPQQKLATVPAAKIERPSTRVATSPGATTGNTLVPVSPPAQTN
jgi:hypothetical protein